MNLKFQQSMNFSSEQMQKLNSLLTTLSHEQKIWLGGYLSGMDKGIQQLVQLLIPTGITDASTSVNLAENAEKLTILFGTRSGNAGKVARETLKIAEGKGISCNLVNMNDYNPKLIKKERNLLIVISTDGEGEPPLAAEEFYRFVTGTNAPKLNHLNYSLLALGDKSYQHFCKTGKDIDLRLKELGASSITERIDCDIDFMPEAIQWAENVLDKYLAKNGTNNHSIINSTITDSPTTVYTSQNPYNAKIINRIKLNGQGSEKSTYHIELDLENSGISYQPGDAIGIVCENSHQSVEDLLKKTGLDGNKIIDFGGTEKVLYDWLLTDFEISVLTLPVMNQYASLLNNLNLNGILESTEKTAKYIYGRDIIDLIEDFPFQFTEESILSVLRKLQPRLYSVASSSSLYPDEVHLTVGAVNYYKNKRTRYGVCSNYITNLAENKSVRLFLDENISFRLPDDNSLPVIMIGAGTGIAPFRAFVQERSQQNNSGKSWLFFGERNFTTDFLYQSEWISHLREKHLTRMDVAFSRDQKEKIYVQNRVLEYQKEIFSWVEEGAHIYVCGDKNNMAKDIRKTFQSIFANVKGISDEKALEFLTLLRKQNRYHEDVY